MENTTGVTIGPVSHTLDPIVQEFLTLTPIGSTFETVPSTAGCPPGFVGKFSFDARLTNKSDSPPFSDLVVEVITLTNGNLLQNADGGPGGVGATLTVPVEAGFSGGFSDGVLSGDEFVDVPFVICLSETKPFSFFVDVLKIGTTTALLTYQDVKQAIETPQEFKDSVDTQIDGLKKQKEKLQQEQNTQIKNTIATIEKAINGLEAAKLQADTDLENAKK